MPLHGDEGKFVEPKNLHFIIFAVVITAHIAAECGAMCVAMLINCRGLMISYLMNAEIAQPIAVIAQPFEVLFHVHRASAEVGMRATYDIAISVEFG